MFDILCTAHDIASTLSHQTTLFMMSHPLQASHHTPISDIAPTVPLSSQPIHWYHTHIWVTKHPPSVWHPMPYIEHHMQSLCHHSTVLMTSQPLYMKAHPVCRATYGLHMRHHSHYLCPHSHCIDNITCILGMTSHSPYIGIVSTTQDITSSVYDLKPPCLCHHSHYIWHLVHCICVITSNLLMISHQLYFWDHIHYSSQHHIHCIRHDTHCMTSQPLLLWHQIPYISHHMQDLWHDVPYSCDITDTMFVNICNYI